jgi:hypothetical protein
MKIKCPQCGLAMTPAQVILNSFASFPNRSWLLFRCPSCTATSHVHVGNGRLAIGDLDGVPGPTFLPVQSVAADQLTDKSSSDGILVELGDLCTMVPARQ